MREFMFDDKPLEDREMMLRDTCDKVEQFSYEKAFTNQDVILFQEELSGIMIQMSQIEDELAAVKKGFTVKMKPLKLQIKELLENIRFRSRMVEEQAYIFIDHEENKVGYYTAAGNLIHTRMLKIDEHQRSIMSEARNYTEEWAESSEVED